MLGSIESDRNWLWAAYGKHPVVKDFFRVGGSFPLAKGFSDWVENGHRILSSKKHGSPDLCSWRFWAKGAGKETLVCGLVRDSSDSVGRLYPLLVVGTGPLEGWEGNWDLLPLACERTWDQIEYLSTLVVNDYRKLEVEIQNIRPPYPEWSEFSIKRGTLRESISSFHTDSLSSELEALEREVSSISGKTEIFLSLTHRSFRDQLKLINLCHFLLKGYTKTVPNTIFMGGPLEKVYLAVFKRPLIPSDFVQLWCVSSDGVKENGS